MKDNGGNRIELVGHDGMTETQGFQRDQATSGCRIEDDYAAGLNLGCLAESSLIPILIIRCA